MYSIVRTVLLGAALVLPLVLVGCSGTDGGGSGGGGAGGTGDNVAMTIEQLCSRLDECNELVGISVTECIELVSTCVGENLPTSSLQQDWARLVNECQAFATCGIFVDCYSDLTCSFDGGTGGSGGAGGVGPGEYFMKCEFDGTEIVIGLSLEADAPEGLVAGAPSTITTQVRVSIPSGFLSLVPGAEITNSTLVLGVPLAEPSRIDHRLPNGALQAEILSDLVMTEITPILGTSRIDIEPSNLTMTLAIPPNLGLGDSITLTSGLDPCAPVTHIWGSERISLPVDPPPPPAAPSDLQAHPFSSSTVSLGWQDNADNEDGFDVYRGTAPDAIDTYVNNVPADTTSYSDSGRSTDVDYYYLVRAFNAGGQSQPSNTASVILRDPAGQWSYTLVGSGPGCVFQSGGTATITEPSERMLLVATPDGSLQANYVYTGADYVVIFQPGSLGPGVVLALALRAKLDWTQMNLAQGAFQVGNCTGPFITATFVRSP